MHICDNLHLEIVENSVFVLESALSPESGKVTPPNYIGGTPNIGWNNIYSYHRHRTSLWFPKEKEKRGRDKDALGVLD